MAGVRVTLNPAALNVLLASPTGPTSRYLLRQGILVSNAAKVLCPVDTGRLRSSIGVSQQSGSGGMVTTVEATADYALYVEEGTRYQRAQPYLRPALDQVMGAIR